ncbi:MAG: phosphoribosylamine--glycine ligase [Nitrospirae bacterium]|nr:MAG: phosphoribosylamine--glycine ligase [Nitrospirota bacterium]
MKVLVVGSGGREHALVWKLAQSARVTALYCAPGNAGISQLATCVPIQATDVAGLKAFAQEQAIDLTVVGPEAPLAEGIADAFRHAKLRIFGPTRNAARIESSKAFAKELMVRQAIPTAQGRAFETASEALRYLDSQPLPIVIKADGLAQGKGVVVAETSGEAREAVLHMLERQMFGPAGRRIVIEQYLPGDELTVMAFADGKTVVPMIPAQDHKRLGEGDVGPNTGGMGAYAPAPIMTPALHERILDRIFYPALEGLARVGSPFYGVLYAGLMIKDGEPFVLEFNARFGDPETQVVLPLLAMDLLDVLEAVIEHRLDQISIRWADQAAVCVVLASQGYPGPYQTGFPIEGLSAQASSSTQLIFHAGTAWKGEKVVTAGGRVLGVTGLGPDLATARQRAYETVESIRFEGRSFRMDIARRALSFC